MPDLWTGKREALRQKALPLAARLRPRTLDEFVGQRHFLAPGTLLDRMLRADRLTSVIFWGPPGTGKTTLAEVIAAHTGRHFERAHAAQTGVKEIRENLAAAARRLEEDDRRTILFIDEIHRFARNQQDVLLGDVENGLVTLIGATTENPFFALNSALGSRSTLFQFKPLNEDEIGQVIRRALTDPRGYGGLDIQVAPEAIAHWARICDGDARRALNALEVAVRSVIPESLRDGGAGAERNGKQGSAAIVIDLRAAEESIQAKALVYDGTGDEHYDIISAFIKSMRGSDPDAAVYWLARMLESGEDPRFIARRIAILASEDIGNADPRALHVATDAWLITERIGMPECQLTLAQAAIYMAIAPKSNACAKAIWSAMEDVRSNRTVPVPTHLRDTHYKGAATLGHGATYAYPHDYEGGHVAQSYRAENASGEPPPVYYEPTNRGLEIEIGKRLAMLRDAARTRSTP